jgi:superfamily II DNA or RNA helicase
MDLFPYQEQMVQTFFHRASEGKTRHLFAAPCAAGKTIVFSEIATEYRRLFPGLQTVILTRIGTLVSQAAEKLFKAFPSSVFDTGIACAKISKKVDVHRPIVIGTIQTLVNYSTELRAGLIIIDEAHQLAPQNIKSQYRRFLEVQLAKRPDLQLIGFTATPYRLGSGFIYSDLCGPGVKNWFPDLAYQISMADLQAQGYLSSYRALEIEDISDDLDGITISSTGDYQTAELSEKMSTPRHVGSAIKALQDHATGRRHVAVFCVDINHAERLCAALNDAGFVSETVHSKKSEYDNLAAIKRFESGKTRCLVSVESLTTGFDATCIECILFARPTQSPALFVQMLGRGLRRHAGKTDCLMLDLAGLFRDHGDPNKPEVWIPTETRAERKKKAEVCRECKHAENDGSNSWLCCNERSPDFRLFVPSTHTCPLWKKRPKCRVCPVCKTLQQRPYITPYCLACGTPFPVKERSQPKMAEDGRHYAMREVRVNGKNGATVMILAGPPKLKRHVSKAGNKGLLLKLAGYDQEGKRRWVNEYMDLTGATGARAQQRGRVIWEKLAGAVPADNDEAFRRRQDLLRALPERVPVVRQSSGFWRIAV